MFKLKISSSSISKLLKGEAKKSNNAHEDYHLKNPSTHSLLLDIINFHQIEHSNKFSAKMKSLYYFILICHIEKKAKKEKLLPYSITNTNRKKKKMKKFFLKIIVIIVTTPEFINKLKRMKRKVI